jgi:hypothetical protein
MPPGGPSIGAQLEGMDGQEISLLYELNIVLKNPDILGLLLQKSPTGVMLQQTNPEKLHRIINTPNLLARMNQLQPVFRQMSSITSLLGQGINPTFAPGTAPPNMLSGSSGDITLSDSDLDNIGQLASITGKSEIVVKEMYIACGKNMEATANNLFAS